MALGKLVNVSADFDHLRIDRDDTGKRLGAILLLQLPIFGLELIEIERPLNDQVQGLDGDRFFVEIIGTHRHGFECILLISVTGDHDDFGMWRELQRLLEGCQALIDTFRIGWQAQILQHDQRLVPAQFINGGGSVLGRNNVIALKAPFQLA